MFFTSNDVILPSFPCFISINPTAEVQKQLF